MIAPRLTPLDAYAMVLHSKSGAMSEDDAIHVGFQFLHYALNKLIDIREEALNAEDTPGAIALHKGIQAIRAQLREIDNEYGFQFKSLPSRVREVYKIVAKEHEMNGRTSPPK